MAVLPPDPVFTLRCAEMGPVNSLCFHRNERLLAGTTKGKIFLWDLSTNRSSLHFEVGHQEPITALHHTDDELLISQEKGGRITLWQMTNTGYKRQLVLPANYMGYCRSVLFNNAHNQEDPLLFYPCDENTIGVLHTTDPENSVQMLVPAEQLPQQKLGTLNCLKPFEHASQIFCLAGYESGYFLTWDLSSGMVVDVAQIEPDPMAVDYNPATNRGVIGGPGDKITTFSYQRQTMRFQRSSDIALKNPGINCIKIRQDQKVFCAGGWDGRVRIFSWKSLRPLAVLTEHKSGAIMDIAYSTGPVAMWKAPIMAVAGMDSQISLWNLYN
ncbi:guanine nucleotide-binding protein subunit beta-like protein 1 [Musca vetustissima]|uniref:guanine nucleotide-binding protein subunit beta-like protein 1 n=1 Tax=Musca vetustissima TaxID=27455 RepID=UPI002AB61E85|nr:guanine nucleotide-binding protein subunit beta-like protein 1 [Musca vetustissima]